MAETAVTLGWWGRRRRAVARGLRIVFSWPDRRLRALLRPLQNWCARHTLGLTITLLLTAFLVVFFWERVVVSIYPGQVGVLWRRFNGTLIDRVYGEGLHLVSPINIMYIYNTRWQVLRRSVVALTRDGLEITADLGLLYRVIPRLAAELHQAVGPNYLEALIIPNLDAAARNILGQIAVDYLYVRREQDVEVDLFERSLLERAREDVGGKYVEVQDLSVLRLTLPSRIQEAIQRKREEEQLALLYTFRLDREEKEAERKRIEARGIRDFQDTITGGLSDRYLTFKGIEATLELAKSSNTKVIVFGDKSGLPLLLGNVPIGPGEAAPP
jgi:regulator of protease activity HflC (stomatin/prohibitin superfamily)